MSSAAKGDVGPGDAVPAGAAGSASKRERRGRILDATVALASKGGFDAVQMRTVADDADVALGTLYRYFPSKIHLLVAALGREFDTAVERTAKQAIPGATPHDRVMYILGRNTKALQQHPQLTEALVRAFMFADASVRDEIHHVATNLATMISRAIAGSPDHDEPTEEEAAIIRVIADVWLSCLVGWVTGRIEAPEVTRRVDTAVGLLFR